VSLVKPSDSPSAMPTDAGNGITEKIAWSITSYLISGALMGALAGWGLDHLFGTHFIVGIGLVVGKALTLYYVWLRYGTH
jgi:F0F1-type ATP synthase assembly protein I